MSDPIRPATPSLQNASSRSARRIDRPPLRFDRNELAGAFGDMGTDVPLLIGMALAAGLDGASVLILFGLSQIATGVLYRLPMPVQPLKAMAAIVIAGQVGASTLYGGALAVGAIMLVLALAGWLDWLARTVPKAVVRGIQLGLGLQLASIALGRYVPSDGAAGYALAALAFVLVIVLLGNRRLPAAIPVVLVGLVWALAFNLDSGAVRASFGLHFPKLHTPALADIASGFVVLAIPQIPLSLGNSVLATRQLIRDLFPARDISIRRIGITYALLNLVNPWFGGIPVCHGSGGMAGHYAFGGRTGGSVVIYGAVFLALGLFFGAGFDAIAGAFPLPVLGVLLLFEGLALVVLMRDLAGSPADFALAALVGIVAGGLPYGYVIGLVVGTLLVRLGDRIRLAQHP